MRVIPPNSLITATFTQNVADLKARTKDTANETVTGRYSDLTKHLGGNIGQAMNSQKAFDDIAVQRNILDIRGVRLELSQSALGRIQDRATGLGTRMIAALNSGDEAARNLVALDAYAALTDVISTLNQRLGDRFLFAGDETATQPFAGTDTLIDEIRQIALTATDAADFESQLDNFFNAPAGGWQTSVYRSGLTNSDPEAVTANDPAIVKLISGLSVLALADTSETGSIIPGNAAILTSAANRVSEGTVDLINLRAELGLSQQRIETSKATLDTEESILNAVLIELTGRDPYAAATELKLLESNLETAYLITGRLSNLSLINFLR